MKKEEVQIGGSYLAKAGKRSVEVKIDGENAKGGWNATTTGSGKPIRVKDARHLRPVGEASVDESDADAPAADEDVVSLAKLDKNRKRSSGKTKKASKPKAEKKPAKEKAPKKPKAMSCLDAAAAVLKAKGEPMQCRQMIDAMAEQGLWKSSAPTPHATLFSAILRELKKGKASRFKKVDRGQFAYQEPKDE